jgi:hypothetical protein
MALWDLQLHAVPLERVHIRVPVAVRDFFDGTPSPRRLLGIILFLPALYESASLLPLEIGEFLLDICSLVS